MNIRKYTRGLLLRIILIVILLAVDIFVGVGLIVYNDMPRAIYVPVFAIAVAYTSVSVGDIYRYIKRNYKEFEEVESED